MNTHWGGDGGTKIHKNKNHLNYYSNGLNGLNLYLKQQQQLLLQILLQPFVNTFHTSDPTRK